MSARMRRLATPLFVLLLAGSASRAGAQAGEPLAAPAAPEAGRSEAPPRVPLVLAGPVDGATYHVGPGDLFSLQLWGQVSRTVSLEVGPEGDVSLPDIGLVRVGGMTLDEARAALLARLRGEVRNVRVEIRLLRPRAFRLTLAGAVLAPGTVVATGSARVGDLLPLASLAPGASRRNIRVRHRDGTVEIADLERLLRAGDGSRDPLLRDGDMVTVPVATEWVEVTGAVASPGRYELAPEDSVSTLFRLAGGPLPAAAADRALWIHWAGGAAPDTVRMSLAEVADGLGGRPMANGDRLYVYFQPNFRLQQQVTIVGEVARPGGYPIREGVTRISEIVAAAGGFLPTANLSAIRVHRVLPDADGKDPELERLLRLSRTELTATEYEVLRTKLAERREDYRLDWSEMEHDPHALDVLLHDGDAILVDRLVSTIRVDGEVMRPAILTFRTGARVSDYIAESGGYTNRAWRGKVRVTRAVSGQTLLARNVDSLDPGDFVWVPEKPDVTTWQQAKEVLSALAQVATIVIAIRSVR